MRPQLKEEQESFPIHGHEGHLRFPTTHLYGGADIIPNRDSVKIIVADDHDLIREGLKLLLAADSCFEVVGEAGNTEDIWSLVRMHSPHLLVLDLNMDGSPNTALIREAKQIAPVIKVLVLTGDSDVRLAIDALQSGADGYFLKGGDCREIVMAIPRVMAGEQCICDSIDRSLREHAMGCASDAGSSTRLTDREVDMLRLVARGLSSHEIATELQLSPNTVRKHRQNLMDKLDLHKATELTAFAIQSGIHKAG